ncbi:hypothetical protein D3C84_890180 [compost metagenome]
MGPDRKSGILQVVSVVVEIGQEKFLCQVDSAFRVMWNGKAEGMFSLLKHASDRKTFGLRGPESGVQQGCKDIGDGFFNRLHMPGQQGLFTNKFLDEQMYRGNSTACCLE